MSTKFKFPCYNANELFYVVENSSITALTCSGENRHNVTFKSEIKDVLFSENGIFLILKNGKLLKLSLQLETINTADLKADKIMLCDSLIALNYSTSSMFCLNLDDFSVQSEYNLGCNNIISSQIVGEKLLVATKTQVYRFSLDGKMQNEYCVYEKLIKVFFFSSYYVLLHENGKMDVYDSQYFSIISSQTVEKLNSSMSAMLHQSGCFMSLNGSIYSWKLPEEVTLLNLLGTQKAVTPAIFSKEFFPLSMNSKEEIEQWLSEKEETMRSFVRENAKAEFSEALKLFEKSSELPAAFVDFLLEKIDKNKNCFNEELEILLATRHVSSWKYDWLIDAVVESYNSSLVSNLLSNVKNISSRDLAKILKAVLVSFDDAAEAKFALLCQIVNYEVESGMNLSVLDSAEVTSLLYFLLIWVQRYFKDGKLKSSQLVPSLNSVFTWLQVLLDSHFSLFVMNDELIGLIEEMHSSLNGFLDSFEAVGDLKHFIRYQIENWSKLRASSSPYSIQVLHI